MLVLKAQMYFETRRFFCGLEKKKHYSPERTINHTGQELWSKNSMNFEGMAGPSIRLTCLTLTGSQEVITPRAIIALLISFRALLPQIK